MPADFDLAAYLGRLGFSGEPRRDFATLAALHEASVRTLPFESLDPFLRRPVSLDLDALQEKIVRGRRGGYCFELNALFAAALREIGFDVIPLAARVRWMSPPEAPLGPREHMLLKVDLPEGPHLADVGFGACLLDRPLPMRRDRDLPTGFGVYRLTAQDGRLALATRRGDGWRMLYLFDETPQLPADYEMANHYTSTSALPPFQHVLICERLVGARRRKLVNRRYIVEARDGVVERERTLETPEQLAQTLDEAFGVTAPIPAEDLFARLPE